jgi:hypothetical protein
MSRWDPWTDTRSDVTSRADSTAERGQWETHADPHASEWLR